MPHFKAFGMMNLQYVIRICYKIHNKGTMSQGKIQVTIFLSGTDVTSASAPTKLWTNRVCTEVWANIETGDRLGSSWFIMFTITWIMTFSTRAAHTASATAIRIFSGRYAPHIWTSQFFLFRRGGSHGGGRHGQFWPRLHWRPALPVGHEATHWWPA